MRRIQLSSERGLALLRLDVDRLVAVDRVHDRRQVELLRIGAGEAAVAVGRPLHRRAHAVAVAEIDSCRPCRSRRRSRSTGVPGIDSSSAVHQLDLAPVVLQQRRQAAADAEIDARARGRRRRCATGSRAPRRSPSRASARRGCAGRSPTGSSSGISGVWRMMSVIGWRSSCASAMYMRGISGKWNAMWHSSPSPK